jgi:glycosyltransferase involved in cell wall biosynthesis
VKVLFATYPMAFHTLGGGEVQLLAYRDHLASHGIEVTLLDPWNPRFLEHDVVHFFSTVGGSWHFCAFVKELGLPLVVSASLWVTPETAGDYPLREIGDQLALAERIVVNSDLEGDALAPLVGLPRERFATVYNGVDERFFVPADPGLARRELGLDDAPFVLCVANIEPRKNQLRLAQAMKALPHHRLVLLGHSRDRTYADAVLAEGGPQLVHPGAVPHESELLASAYAACAAFALPSHLETPGLAALEAGAQGAPVVITPVGSTRAYFGDLATYADPHSVDAIVAAITTAIDRPRDDALSTALRRFTWDNCVRDLVPLYGALASRG